MSEEKKIKCDDKKNGYRRVMRHFQVKFDVYFGRYVIQ